eukprot:2055746-Pyramimonas_sp.AAC.1
MAPPWPARAGPALRSRRLPSAQGAISSRQVLEDVPRSPYLGHQRVARPPPVSVELDCCQTLGPVNIIRGGGGLDAESEDWQDHQASCLRPRFTACERHSAARDAA